MSLNTEKVEALQLLPLDASYSVARFRAPSAHLEGRSLDIDSYGETESKSRSRKGLATNGIKPLTLLITPLVAYPYLSFCYYVHFHTLDVGVLAHIGGNNQSISLTKSIVTSISVVIVTIALYPVRSLILDLKSEEFFRSISRSGKGVPLNSVNSISTPSFGFLDTCRVIYMRHASLHLLTAFILSFLVLAMSVIASAALSVSTALVDGNITALEVGALTTNAFLVTSNIYDTIDGRRYAGPGLSSEVGLTTSTAAIMAWVESVLGIPNSFQVDDPGKHIVPTPLTLPLSIPARWLSDVVIINPSCTWSTAKMTTENDSSVHTFNLTQGYTIKTDQSDLGVTYELYTDRALASADDDHIRDGTAIWTFGYCTSCVPPSNLTVRVDFAQVPTYYYQQEIRDFAHAGLIVHTASFLTCSPNAAIETREVRHDGQGRLTVMDRQQPTRQGNLDIDQVNEMLSTALSTLFADAGPDLGLGVGSQGMMYLVFGPEGVQRALRATNLHTSTSNDPSNLLIWAPSPSKNITEVYAKLVNSAVKAWMGDQMGSAYVPAMIAEEKIVFSSSIPYIAASTVIFTILTVASITLYFRQHTSQFTLSAVALSLNVSNLPSLTALALQDDVKPLVQYDDVGDTLIGERVVSLSTSSPIPTLQLH